MINNNLIDTYNDFIIKNPQASVYESFKYSYYKAYDKAKEDCMPSLSKVLEEESRWYALQKENRKLKECLEMIRNHPEVKDIIWCKETINEHFKDIE